jgi:hypothetical protein
LHGEDPKREGVFSYASPEKQVPADHPLRAVREMVDGMLKEMSPRFAGLYAEVGRSAIAPERLLRALLLQIFYSLHSERMLMEHLITTCCSGGSWGWPWTRRCGTTRCSARIGSDC